MDSQLAARLPVRARGMKIMASEMLHYILKPQDLLKLESESKKAAEEHTWKFPGKKRPNGRLIDPNKAQAAIHVRKNDGSGTVAGDALDLTATVDARKSVSGGIIETYDSTGVKTKTMDVCPGSKGRDSYFNTATSIQGINGLKEMIRGAGDCEAIWHQCPSQ